MIKSPFLVVQDFLSPLLCEEIVDNLNFMYPDTDVDGHPIKTSKGHELSEEMIFPKFKVILPSIQKHFGVDYRGTEPMLFEWYPHGCDGETPHCENSNYVNRKWTKMRDRDLTCILFMCDYQETTPFDSEFEVYGGKIEFVQHQFGFNPQRGTLIVFPSGPNFINNTSPILAGDLFLARFHIATIGQYTYNPQVFPGDFTSWFEEIA